MAEGGAKFMAAEGVDRVEWENFEELRNKCWEALRCTCDLVSRLRGRLGILTEGKQGRSLFKNARNREALRVRDRNAGRNILWERLLKFWNCRMRTWYGFSKLKMPLPSWWWSLELIMKNMLVDRKERHWFDSGMRESMKEIYAGLSDGTYSRILGKADDMNTFLRMLQGDTTVSFFNDEKSKHWNTKFCCLRSHIFLWHSQERMCLLNPMPASLTHYCCSLQQ